MFQTNTLMIKMNRERRTSILQHGGEGSLFSYEQCQSVSQLKQSLINHVHKVQKIKNSFMFQTLHRTRLDCHCLRASSFFFFQFMTKNESKENIHEKFNQLLKQLNKANAPYALSVANRLYGEQSYKFVQVCVLTPCS